MHQIQFNPLGAVRESLRSTLRQCLVFIFFGTAVSAVVNSRAIEHYVMEGNLLAGIVYMLVFGCFFGIPAWIAVRVLRFALGR